MTCRRGATLATHRRAWNPIGVAPGVGFSYLITGAPENLRATTEVARPNRSFRCAFWFFSTPEPRPQPLQPRKRKALATHKWRRSIVVGSSQPAPPSSVAPTLSPGPQLPGEEGDRFFPTAYVSGLAAHARHSASTLALELTPRTFKRCLRTPQSRAASRSRATANTFNSFFGMANKPPGGS